MPRISKSPDKRRSELIAVAQQLFFTKGFDKTSVGEIVKTADVAKGLFYYYFDSKQAILEAMIDDILQRELTHVQTVVEDPTLDAITKWKTAIQHLAAWEVANADELLPLLATTYKPENVRFLHYMQTQSVAIFSPGIAVIIAEGVQQGVFHVPHAAEVAQLIMGILLHTLDPIAKLILAETPAPTHLADLRQILETTETSIARILGVADDALNSNTFALLEDLYQED